MKASGAPRRIPGVHVIVLGIDPGVANTGYGIVAHDRGRLVALDGGVIETAARTDAGARLAHIHARVSELLDAYRPEAVAVEDLYFGTNAHSAFAVGQARGVVILAAGQKAIRCSSYTPQQVKSAVCGSGRAGDEIRRRKVLAAEQIALPPPPLLERPQDPEGAVARREVVDEAAWHDGIASLHHREQAAAGDRRLPVEGADRSGGVHDDDIEIIPRQGPILSHELRPYIG